MMAIALLPTVAAQLTGDGALMIAKQQGDLSLVVASFPQDVYLVSLFTGKLFIVHWGASFDLVVNKACSRYRSLPLTTNFKSCTSS
jgi:hypothetical protein